MDMPISPAQVEEATSATLTDEQVATLLTNVAPKHPALRRVHQKLNGEGGIFGEAIPLTSHSRMHHRHNRS